MYRDRTPIDQNWIRDYVDEFTKIAITMPNGAFKDSILRRIECVQDLVEAWQLRNIPIENRIK